MTRLLIHRPWPSLLARDVERLFDAVPAPAGAPALPVNLWEHQDGYTLHAELPGVRLEDVELSITGPELTITVQREAQQFPQDALVHRRERPAGRLTRRLRLQDEIDTDRVSATLRDGILNINLPKHERAKPRRITVSQA